MTEYIIVVGTGERTGDENLPTAFLRPLLKPGDTLRYVEYPASIGPANPTPGTWGAGLTRSRTAGLGALAHAVAVTPNVPVLLGYSLGAYVVSDYLEALAAGRYPGHEVAGAIMLANPRAPRVNGREGLARGHGRFPSGVPVIEVRNYWDLICNTPSDSPLMKVTGLVAVATGGLMEGFDLAAWVLQELLRASRLPTMDDYRLVTGYANGPEHTTRYLSEPMFRAAVRDWIRSHGF